MKHDRKLYTQPKAGIACTGHTLLVTRTQKVATAAMNKPVAAPVEAARNIALYALD